MKRMVPTTALALVGTALLAGLPGCQSSYPFEVRGKVRGSEDGASLAGVRVLLRGDGALDLESARPSDPHGRGAQPFSAITGPDGSFSFRFQAWDHQFHPPDGPVWTLDLSKDGYRHEVIEIGPVEMPESGRGRTMIVVVGFLKPDPSNAAGTSDGPQ